MSTRNCAFRYCKNACSFGDGARFGWRLSDREVADVATFVRTSWGNSGSPVTAAQVAKLRRAYPGTRPDAPAGASFGRGGKSVEMTQ